MEGSSTPLTGRVARGTIINAGAALIAGGLFALRNVIAAALMQPRALAVWAVAGVVLLSAMTLRGVGIVERFVADRDRPAREAFNDAFSVGLLFSGLVGVLVAALAPVLTLAYDDPRLLLPLLAVGGLVVLDGLKFPIWWHYRELNYGTQRAVMLADAAFSVLFAIPLMALGWEWWGLIAGAAIASVCTIVLAWSISPHPRARRPSRATIGRYASFGGPILSFALAAAVVGHLAYLAVRHSAGLEALGWLAVAAFPFVVAERLASVLNQSVYPALVRRGDASRERATELMQRVVWAGMAPMLFLLAVLAPWLIPLALGDEYEIAGRLMALTAVCTVLHQFGFPFAVVVMSTGSTRAIGRFAAIYLGVTVLVVIPITLLFGIEGYAVSLPVITIMLAAERWRILRDKLPGANLFRHAGRDLLFALLPAAGAGIALLVSSGEAWELRLTLAVLLATEGFLALIWHHRPLAATLLAAIRRPPAAAHQMPEATGAASASTPSTRPTTLAGAPTAIE